VNLGFWNSKDSIKDILTYVLQILAKGKNINYVDALV